MAATPRKFKIGEFVFREGSEPKCMFLIQKGNVSIRKSKGQGYVELAQLHAKEVLGELSFLDRQPRSAAAVALTDVELLEIDFDSLDKVYAQVPDYIKTIMVAVAARLRRADEAIRRLEAEVVPAPAEKK